MAKQGIVLCNQADPASQSPRLASGKLVSVATKDLDVAGVRPDQPPDHAQQQTLARSGPPGKEVERAGRHSEVDAPQQVGVSGVAEANPSQTHRPAGVGSGTFGPTGRVRGGERAGHFEYGAWKPEGPTGPGLVPGEQGRVALEPAPMILTCPACATSYFVPDEAFGPRGRTVRCQSCSHSWHATADEPLELKAEAVPTPPVVVAADTAAAPAPESLAETPAPELPKAYRARVETARRTRRAALHGAAWAGVASVFVGLLAGAWLFRAEVVDVLPRTAVAYAAVGMPVNVTGLEFEAVGARALPDTPGKVMVSGALRNVRDREIVAPAIRVALLDDHGVELSHAVVRTDGAPVLPGQVSGFAVVLADPGGKATGVGVDFVLDAPPPVAVQRPSAPDPHTAPPPASVVEVEHPPVVAEMPALRPAHTVSTDTPHDLAPAAAVPLDSHAH